MKQILGPATGALACGLFLVFGCGGSSFEGGGGGGGSANAGTAGSSSGGDGTAGSSSAGKTGGGSSNGGSADAGTSSGGSANAGTGGTGGTSMAGSASGGGMGGGATMSCEQDTDCTVCAYPTAPQTTGECYCASCASTPMSKASCMANQAQYAKVCANVHLPCPAIACVLPPEPVCRSHMCVAK